MGDCHMEIKREAYLNRLIARKHNSLVKVITGIRRSGKSYLMNVLFYNHLLSEGIPLDHIIRFAFDSADDLIRIEEDPLLLGNDKEQRRIDPSKFLNWLLPQIKDAGRYYVLLDEVQKLGAFESVINGLMRRSNLDLYVTGSNSKFLSKDVLTEFEGRGDEIHVLPLSFSEFYSFKGGDKGDAFDDYSVYGGLPFVALLSTEEQKTNYLITQMNNVYLKDIANRYSVSDGKLLGEVVDVIASGISSLTNPNRIASTMKSIHKTNISNDTVDQYISHAEDAFLIKKANRYDVKGRKYISTPYKIYFEDVGLRNARLSFRQIEETHIMENIIYNELRYRGYLVDVGVVESREKDCNGKEKRIQREIDFVAQLGNKKYYIQSAFAIEDENKYREETASFQRVKDSFKKIILVGKTMKPRYDQNGFLWMGVKEFLLDPESLSI